MFSSLLIANRGEIACRIARTAKAMGLRVVAVYSEADRDAAHVAIADTAHLIGPAQASQSYLNGDAIIAAAQAAGAEAIHPGYGFLAENADFAEAVLAAGLVWVGPPPSAITRLVTKLARGPGRKVLSARRARFSASNSSAAPCHRRSRLFSSRRRAFWA